MGGRPTAALAVLVVAGLTDAFDGPLARRRKIRTGAQQTGSRGDWLDPLCDKIFMGLVVAGLVLAQRPPLLLLLLLVARELLQLVALAVMRLTPGLRRVRYDFRAHPIGKAATVAQFLTVGLLVVAHPAAWMAAWMAAWTAAGLGVAALVVYIHRGLAGHTA